FRRNRSASDSVVHDRRHQRYYTDHIELSVEIRNLIPEFSIENENLICILYENDDGDEKKWKLYSASEPQIAYGGHAEFVTLFAVDYVFERTQLIKIEIRNFSSRSSSSITSGNIVGSAIFKLDELIGAFGAQLCKVISPKATIASALSAQAFPMQSAEYRGTLIITGHLASKAEPVILQFVGRNLERRGKFFDETEVYFLIHRVENNDERTLLYQSEYIKNHSRPSWNVFNLQMKQIADNRNRLLEVSVMYRDEVGKIGFIGSFLTSYAKMKYGPGPENIYNVINHKKLTKKGYLNSGKFELTKFTDVSFYSFLDYITSGTQLHFAIAYDFSIKKSLTEEAQSHVDADFQMALRAIGEIIRDYSPNKLFPALGFGAKIPPAFYESQEFCLILMGLNLKQSQNFDTDPCCRGIDGVLDAYRKANRIVMPIEKATFYHIIHYVSKMAINSGAKGLHYYVLAIFTQSGPMEDLKEVLKALLHASKAPLSVIFIGLGDGNFDDFYRLAGKHHHESRNRPEREIVEFLELNSVFESTECAARNKRRIAERALHSVPWHLVSYMHKNNIAAKPPIQISRSPIFHASYLIPDRPTIYDDNDYWETKNKHGYCIRPKSSTPCRQRSHFDRSPTSRSNRANSAIDQTINLNRMNRIEALPPLSNRLDVIGLPYRSHSAIQSPHDEFQRHITQRQAFFFDDQTGSSVLERLSTLNFVEGNDENALRIHSRIAKTPSDFH
ncbi:unnamed protein product, partial [Anisakis simplex]|uniref:Copine family protein 5 (inferred by orthology to a C. elegans protein) n=1 Tax=Anisakis simplex TaxID=6269 RepID=A0A0M3JSZ4_ANISI